MRFLQDNDNNPNGNILNSEKNNNFMVVLRLRNLCVEIFKSLTKNQSYLHEQNISPGITY